MQTSGMFSLNSSKNSLDKTLSLSNPETDTYESLKEAFRTLQGHYVELQIELQSAKTDRDSLLLELRASKEALADLNGSNYYGPIAGGPGSLMSDMSASVYSSEKSMKDLKDILRRKEEMIDKLLADLADEKHARVALEQSAKNDMIRHLTEVEEIKRKNYQGSEIVQQLREELNLLTEQRTIMSVDINSRNKTIEELNEKYRLQSQTMLGLVTQVESLKTELQNLKALKEAGDATILELNRSIAEAKSDINLIISERNSLRSLVAQQDAALRVQSEQSDASLSILQQRQALIEKFQNHTKSVEDELTKLQSVLQLLISRNGDELMAELVDLRHLVDVVSNARKKLSSPGKIFQNGDGSQYSIGYQSPKHNQVFSSGSSSGGVQGGMNNMNNITNSSINNQTSSSSFTSSSSSTFPSQISPRFNSNLNNQSSTSAANTALSGNNNSNLNLNSNNNNNGFRESGNQTLLNQTYPRSPNKNQPGSIFHSTSIFNSTISTSHVGNSSHGNSSHGNSGQNSNQNMINQPVMNNLNVLSEADIQKIRALVEENERLRTELAKVIEEAKNARDELAISKDNMQKEYEALWITVHELNKLDNARDKEMKDLIISRDQAIKDRNAVNDRLRRLGDAYNELQQELRSIDQDLIAVAEAENIQIVRADTRRRIRGLLR